jgi:Nif-specific regulatory protein
LNFSKTCESSVCHAKAIPLLSKISETVIEEMNLSQTLSVLFDIMKNELGIVRGSINLFNHKTGKIFIHKSIGLTEEEKARGVYSIGEGITGKVIELRKTIIVPRISDNPDFLNRTKSRSNQEDMDSSFFCVPILKGKKILGSISAERIYENIDLLNQDVSILKIAASIIAQAVELYLIENVEKVLWEKENLRLLEALKEKFHPSNIIGNSKPMMEVYAFIEKIARAKTTVLILGESGVGKELVAEAIHYNSVNNRTPFIKFNCAALPENIVESELFGHEKGAFTGAVSQRLGRFEEADGGTIFLDEVGELSLAIQAKLLRVLQEKTFQRVGSNKSVRVNIRIIAATNKDLNEMVKLGKFRGDLYYRLNVFPILVPPLRERGSDIIALTDYFILKYSKEHNKECNKISSSALEMLNAYFWPGNVRELENVIERAIILSNSNEIHSYDLPSSLQSVKISENADENNLKDKNNIVEYEKIIESLKETHGNITKTADKIGMTRRMLGYRLEKYDINYKEYRSQD